MKRFIAQIFIILAFVANLTAQTDAIQKTQKIIKEVIEKSFPELKTKKVEVKKIEPVKPEPKKTEVKKVEPVKPESKKIEARKPEPKRPEPKKVEVKKVEAKKPEPKKPEPKKAAPPPKPKLESHLPLEGRSKSARPRGLRVGVWWCRSDPHP